MSPYWTAWIHNTDSSACLTLSICSGTETLCDLWQSSWGHQSPLPGPGSTDRAGAPPHSTQQGKGLNIGHQGRACRPPDPSGQLLLPAGNPEVPLQHRSSTYQEVQPFVQGLFVCICHLHYSLTHLSSSQEQAEEETHNPLPGSRAFLFPAVVIFCHHGLWKQVFHGNPRSSRSPWHALKLQIADPCVRPLCCIKLKEYEVHLKEAAASRDPVCALSPADGLAEGRLSFRLIVFGCYLLLLDKITSSLL